MNKKKKKITFFETIIIKPVSKAISKLSKASSKLGEKTEQLLMKKNTMVFVTLFIAIIMFILVDQQMLMFKGESAEVLKNQSVTVVYNEEAYTIEGIPDVVDITLIGRKADLYFAKQNPNHEITLDLSDLKPGTHKVSLKYTKSLATLEYQVNPGEVTVVIKNKISQTKTLTIDVLNQDKLDSKLVISQVKIDNDKVIIKGSEEVIKSVSVVKALVDVQKIGKQEVGTSTIKDVLLKAYDKNGEPIEVEIIPGKVNAELVINSPSKELPIKVIPKGELAFGYGISSIEVSETKLLAYGEANVIENIKYIPVEVDITGLKSSKEYKLEINKPSGISSISVTNITITIKAGRAIDKEISNVNIIYENLKDGYVVQGLSAEDIKVPVIVKGVEAVVNEIKQEDVKVSLNLNGLAEGEHEVEVEVSGTDLRVQYISKTKKVKILIKKK